MWRGAYVDRLAASSALVAAHHAPIRHLDYRVYISGAELTVQPVQAVRDYYFNKAMRCLYDSGCRRIRSAVPDRPRTGDAELYTIRGYLPQGHA